MARYRVDIPVWATVRIEAASKTEALAKVHGLHLNTLTMNTDDDLGEGIELSPAATIWTQPDERSLLPPVEMSDVELDDDEGE